MYARLLLTMLGIILLVIAASLGLLAQRMDHRRQATKIVAGGLAVVGIAGLVLAALDALDALDARTGALYWRTAGIIADAPPVLSSTFP